MIQDPLDHDAFGHLYEVDSSVLPMHRDPSEHPDLDHPKGKCT